MKLEFNSESPPMNDSIVERKNLAFVVNIDFEISRFRMEQRLVSQTCGFKRGFISLSYRCCFAVPRKI